MRVLLLSNRYPNPEKPYAAMFVQRHVELHRAMGADIQVLTPNSAPQRQIAKRIIRQLSFIGRVLWAFLFSDFDVVHAHWPFPAGLLGAVVSIVRRKPLVVTSHGAMIDDFEQRPWLIQRLVLAVLNHATAVIAVGKQHHNKVRQVTQLPADRCFTIPMGVWHSGTLLDRASARHHLSLPAAERIVIFVGNLEPVKGADILLEAIYNIPADRRNFQLYIGGQGLQRSALEQWAATHGLADSIHFLGAIPSQEVSTWLAAADLCVVPSRSEAYGLVALEAMANQTAVLASAVGGLQENIEHGRTGLLFPCQDVGQLANDIEQMLNDAALRQRLVQSALHTVQQHEMQAQAARVFNLYTLLLQSSMKVQVNLSVNK
ncbi:MAG: glycosyltransferase [Caldilineaceae bacterium]